MFSEVAQALEKVIALVAPHRCVKCGATGELLCGACLDELKIASRPACFACNKFSAFGRTCPTCRRKFALDGVTVGTYYDEPVREFIARVKYERSGSQIKLGTKLITAKLYEEDFDLVTWVPAAPTRARQRGYNQAELLAKSLARELRLPCARLLYRFNIGSQVGQSRTSRLKRVRNQFYSSQKELKGKRVLIVDDVLTTGATLGECARELKKAGAKNVWGATLAKH